MPRWHYSNTRRLQARTRFSTFKWRIKEKSLCKSASCLRRNRSTWKRTAHVCLLADSLIFLLFHPTRGNEINLPRDTAMLIFITILNVSNEFIRKTSMMIFSLAVLFVYFSRSPTHLEQHTCSLSVPLSGLHESLFVHQSASGKCCWYRTRSMSTWAKLRASITDKETV